MVRCTYNGWGWGGAMDYMQVSRKKELHFYLHQFVQQQKLYFAYKMYTDIHVYVSQQQKWKPLHQNKAMGLVWVD